MENNNNEFSGVDQNVNMDNQKKAEDFNVGQKKKKTNVAGIIVAVIVVILLIVSIPIIILSIAFSQLTDTASNVLGEDVGIFDFFTTLFSTDNIDSTVFNAGIDQDGEVSNLYVQTLLNNVNEKNSEGERTVAIFTDDTQLANSTEISNYASKLDVFAKSNIITEKDEKGYITKITIETVTPESNGSNATIFNADIEVTGDVTGSNVQLLLASVAVKNNQDTRTITVSYNDKEVTDMTSIFTIQYELAPFDTYNVTNEKDSEGYITKIIIK